MRQKQCKNCGFMSCRNKPQYIIFTVRTKWSHTFLGRFEQPFNRKRAAKGLYSFAYKHLKTIYGPKVASLLNVGMEKIRVRIDFMGTQKKREKRNAEIILPMGTQ